MKKSYVYKISCKINGEFYFGSSFKAKKDWYWGSGRRIKEHIAKYGKENFVKEILGEFNDRVEAHMVENEYIEQFRHDEKCLNQRLDYHFGSFSEETCAKISAANLGKHQSDETRAKISATIRVKLNTDETRAKISAATRGRHLSKEHRAKISAAKRGDKNPMYGKHRTAATRAKISAAKLGKRHTDETRAKISAALRGKMSAVNRGNTNVRGKHWRKNPITGKREYYD